MKKIKLVGAVLGLLSVSQIANSATITNGNFDSGLSGWSAEGNVTVDNGYAVLSTVDGIGTSVYGGTNGSILSQTVNALAGDVISFNFNFDTFDVAYKDPDTDEVYSDFALVAGDKQYLIYDAAKAENDFGSSGWQTYSFTALSSFSDLKFIVSNDGDTWYDSILSIDNITLTSGAVSSVPVPAAVWLFGSGLLGLLGLNHKRSQSLAA